MTDQANRLRDLVQQRMQDAVAVKHTLSARVICISSGKGGVGKTNMAINLAIHMRKLQKRVVLIDADFGLANVEVLFGINPKYNFGDVLTGLVSISSALTIGPLGVMFLSGGSGLTSLADITEQQMTILIESFQYLDDKADIILIDTGAGMSRSVVNFVKASQEVVIVATPDPTSVTDAYALIKTVKDTAMELPSFKLLVNRVESPREGAEVYEKLNGVCGRFLGIKLESLGSIPNDPMLGRAVKRQQPVSILYPNTESARCIEAICAKLLNMPPEKKTGIRSFVSRLVGRLGS